MNTPRNLQRLRRALDLIRQVADEASLELAEKAAATLAQNPGPVGVGRMLALSRYSDTLERLAGDLADLLDEPPRSPGPITLAPSITIHDAA